MNEASASSPESRERVREEAEEWRLYGRPAGRYHGRVEMGIDSQSNPFQVSFETFGATERSRYACRTGAAQEL